jgi:hypothetical protein
MKSDSLSSVDKEILGQALRASVDGPFFPDWEFHILFGLERSEVRAIAATWPESTAIEANYIAPQQFDEDLAPLS